MKKRLFMPLKLQFFADPEDGSQETTSTETKTDPDEEAENEGTGKTFSRDEVAKMIAAEKEKALNKAKEEWEKQKTYEQMSAQERIEAKEKEAKEKENLAEQREKEAQARLDRLERADAVRKDLSESGLSNYIDATAADLLLVKDNDEDTKKATDAMKAIIEAAREGIQKELLRGGPVEVASATQKTSWRDNLKKNMTNIK